MLRPAEHPALTLSGYRRPALVAGHPGHELKVFGWLTTVRPLVYLITDGSGRDGVPRTASTHILITNAGANGGELFGMISDAGIYRAILEQNFGFFLEVVDRLADSFIRHGVDCVAGDAAEGFNPTHDICRTMINAAILIAERASGGSIENLEFCLTEWEPNSPPQQHDNHCLHLTLGDDLLLRKLTAAEAYVELRNEVRSAIASRGTEYFRIECFRRVLRADSWNSHVTRPVYETWGEQRVAAGKYGSVIRFEKHVLPVMEAILAHAAQAEREEISAG